MTYIASRTQYCIVNRREKVKTYMDSPRKDSALRQTIVVCVTVEWTKLVVHGRGGVIHCIQAPCKAGEDMKFDVPIAEVTQPPTRCMVCTGAT